MLRWDAAVLDVGYVPSGSWRFYFYEAIISDESVWRKTDRGIGQLNEANLSHQATCRDFIQATGHWLKFLAALHIVIGVTVLIDAIGEAFTYDTHPQITTG